MQTMYFPPQRVTHAPHGAMCKVIGENETVTYYIQTSEDPENAHWERVGVLLEKLFMKEHTHEDFGKLLLKVLKTDSGDAVLSFTRYYLLD